MGVYGDISYLPAPLQFFKLTQVFDFSLVLTFIGLMIWQISKSGKVSRRTVLSALGFTLLVFGVICSVIVYLQIDVLTGRNLPWGSYAWGSERVAYNTQFMGAEYNCTFLNYAQLLDISVALSFVGFILWAYYGELNFKSPSIRQVIVVFAASIALLVSGLFLVFPGEKFTVADPSMPATPYAVQGVMLVWTGAVSLMAGIIGFCVKLKQALDVAVVR